jgi:hypothetical protein
MDVGGVEILVETVRLPGTEPVSRLGDATAEVREAFTRAQSTIAEIATTTAQRIWHAGGRAVRPDAVEIQFGVKFSAQGHVIVAGASAEATLNVKLVYDRRDRGAAADDDSADGDADTDAGHGVGVDEGAGGV